MKKRLLAICLTLCLALSLLPASALADTTTNSEPILPEGVTEASFGSNVILYNNTYYQDMRAALEAFNEDSSGAEAVFYCRPGATIPSYSHMPLTRSLTVYGNGATLDGGEQDFAPDHAAPLTADLNLTVYNLSGASAWGSRQTEYTINYRFIGCQNMGKVYLTKAPGSPEDYSTNNTTLENCSFTKDTMTHGSCAVYSNAQGTITIKGCTFTGVPEPINLNNKAAPGKTQTIIVEDCTFQDCSTTDICTTDATWAAPIRIVSSAGAASNLTVDNCTFVLTDADAGYCNGQILLGDGRVGETSYPVSATIKNTTADVQIQNPGDRTADGNTAEIIPVTASAVPTDLSSAAVKNETTGVSYTTLKAAVDDAASGHTLTLLTDVTNGGGVVIESGKNLTIDFDSHTYTVTHDPAGSPGSETQCFQLLRDSTITMKNGALVCSC